MAKNPTTQTAAELRLRQRNTRILVRLFVTAGLIIVSCAIAFERIMELVEGQSQTILTGFYWTLSTMTTLGVGDIVFVTPVGRLFTTLVLSSGIVLFFFIFPFAFVRFFYAPWLETRKVSTALSEHVIITSYDNIAPGLVERLHARQVPYFVIEPDPTQASRLHDDGISVFTGSTEDRQTYERLRADTARLVLANSDDTINANIILTVREVAQHIAILATADKEASVDILELAGATRVFTPKRRLGQQLALRLNSGTPQAHQIGIFRDLAVAELPVHNTPYMDRPLRDLKLREELGINVIGIITQSRFEIASPETVFNEHNVPVVLGSPGQIKDLNKQLARYQAPDEPVVIIGAGKVGRAAALALRDRGVTVHIVEQDASAYDRISHMAGRVVIGDAAEREVLQEAGLEHASGVIISTNDDATNIYLTIYCRRLIPDIRIVSRISSEHNMEAIRRAGADLALSHYSLGIQAVFSMLRGGVLLPLGEGFEIRHVAVPPALAGRTLLECQISSRTGVNVVAIEDGQQVEANPDPTKPLSEDQRLYMVGAIDAFDTFTKTFR